MSSQQTPHRHGTAPFYSPLRYPGGKRKLANFLASIVCANGLMDGHYAEVFAGGSSVALALLFGEYVRSVHINDRDRGVHAFWLAVRDQTSAFCRLIREARLDLAEWERQRAIQLSTDPDPLLHGFSTFYLNRVNRSGILMGGPIGGRDQRGKWGMDARFNRDDLVRRVERIGRWRSRINLYDLDGVDFLNQVDRELPGRSFVYLDPPYYIKGAQMLYVNYYGPEDHIAISKQVAQLGLHWAASYDDVHQVRSLYKKYRSIRYTIAYSAHLSYRGTEVMFFSDGLKIPDVPDPTRVTTREIEQVAASA